MSAYDFSAPEKARIAAETPESLLEWAEWTEGQLEHLQATHKPGDQDSANTIRTWRRRAAYLRKIAAEKQDPDNVTHQLAAALRDKCSFYSRMPPSCQYPMADPCMCERHITERAEAALALYTQKFPDKA